MPRPILRPPTRLALLSLLLLLAALPAAARTLTMQVARVATPVATLGDVQVRLRWRDGAGTGELEVRAARVDAVDLGYRFRDVAWRCLLSRDGVGGWRCDGELRAGDGAPLRLSVDLATASTDAVLTRGPASLSLRRSAATPDLTRIDLARVPLAWAQALASQGWEAGRLGAGTLNGRLLVATPSDAPLRVTGTLGLAAAGVDTPDGSIAAEGLEADVEIDYHRASGTTTLALDAVLRGGDLLAAGAYVALPPTPVRVAIAGTLRDGGGWDLSRVSWDDGAALRTEGSAAFTDDGTLRTLDMALRSDALAPLPARYLSAWLGVAGLSGMALDGALDARIAVRDGALADLSLVPQRVSIADAAARFAFDGVEGALRYALAGGAIDSTLSWRGARLGQVAIGPASWPWRSGDGRLRLLRDVRLPVLGGEVTISGLALQPPRDDQGLRLEGGVALDGLQLGGLSEAFGGPAFPGTLGGRIPRVAYADQRLAVEGDLVMQVFDGSIRASGLAMERPFGVAPTLSADLALDQLDLLAITGVFDLGSVSGRLGGRIDGLRLVDWRATAFDAQLRTQPRRGVRQRISQRAVQDIGSVGDASFATSLQGQLIGLFDDFGYRHIGVSCRLANGVCQMGGLRSVGDGFTLVEGRGIPRLDVVGFNRRVDWATLVERLAAVGSGEVAPVFD